MGVSSPCSHVTCVLTVLYNIDTCAIHLPTSESSSNSSVYAHPHNVNHTPYTYRNPSIVTRAPSHTTQRDPRNVTRQRNTPTVTHRRHTRNGVLVMESVMECVIGVSSPCRHVTSVLTVLYNTDTCAIILSTSELSSNSSVYADAHALTHVVTHTPSCTYRNPTDCYSHTVTHDVASPTQRNALA